MERWTVRKRGSLVPVLFEDGKYVGEFDHEEQAIEIARKLNAFDEMLAALKDLADVVNNPERMPQTATASQASWDRFNDWQSRKQLAQLAAKVAIANAEAANV